MNVLTAIQQASYIGFARGKAGQVADFHADGCDLHRLPYAVGYAEGRKQWLRKQLKEGEGSNRATLAEEIESELRHSARRTS